MSVTPVTSLEMFKKIIAQDKYTVFDFWATWCGPCRMISPIFEQLAGKHEHVDFYKVDVDEQEAVAQEVAIRVMPTFILFKNGEMIETVHGAIPANLDKLLAKAVQSVDS